ncbi:MAG TPA: exonuclease SbcCD subunit D [Candidatus Angelobacter sp.]|nr:exonuclease SbcCD subunit D [Candidatus Angelobacter sp.]
MRILHTADWHAGKTLWNRSRAAEQEKVYAEIIGIARKEKADVVAIAGDIFENFAPSPDAERLVYSALAELIGAGIPVIVAGGNHDNPKRLAALREMLAPLNIFVRAEPQRPEAGGVIDIQVRNEKARIAVLPWVPDNKVIDIGQLMGPEDEWYKAYSDNVAAMCDCLAQSFTDSTVNILVGHLFAFGAEASGSERPIHISAPYAIAPARFPTTAQYVALGHLHRPQEIICPTICRYAGSPLQLDFGERDQQKSVVMVDVKVGKPAKVETIELTAGRKLRELRGNLEEIKNCTGTTGEDFLSLVVQTEKHIPGIADQLRELFPDVLKVAIECAETQQEAPELSQQKKPHEHFADFFKNERGIEPSEEIMEAFQLLEREAQSASN